VEDVLKRRDAAGRRPKALVAVHLYGQSADLDALVALCERYGVTLIEDAAEALGARYWGGEEGRGPSTGSGTDHESRTTNHGRRTTDDGRRTTGRSPGTFGKAGIFSFNGNKIITTS